ncbi:MAG: thiamine diphosphokinase [Bacteroidaceae bacterium]|nr:thiamine diphosphokinase [Bacteroidaceae bacterium]
MSSTNNATLPTPVVILAAGDFPTHPVPLSCLEGAATVVCLDSAADTYVPCYGLPDYVVGDGDSISPALRERLGQRFVHESEQDTNDLCKAVRFLAGRGVKEAVVVGATGRREDHTLGNIFHLPDLSRVMTLTMVTDYGRFIPVSQHIELETHIGQAVSVFNIHATRIYSTGLRWPLSAFQSLWQGTLNEANEQRVTIDTDGDIIVYLAHHETI